MVAGCKQNGWVSNCDLMTDHYDSKNGGTTRPLLWTSSLPRKAKKCPGEFGFYERTESCYDLTTLDFGVKKSEPSSIVRTQSGLIVPPRQRKNSCKAKHPSQQSLVRTQSGQIVPPRLKKSRSNLKLESLNNTEKDKQTCLDKVPPTPPKRKKHLQMEKINQLFMNFVNSNGQEGMQLGEESNKILISTVTILNPLGQLTQFSNNSI